MIRGIVFDLWNTLAHDPAGPSPVRMLGEALGITAEDGWKRRIERGMMMAPAAGIEAGLRQLEAREGLRLRPGEQRDTIIRRWHEAAGEAVLYPDVLPALQRLHGRFLLGLCSNTQSFGLEFLGREGLWQHLDAAAFSFEAGALKPRPEIFHCILQRLNLAPETVLMVGDDRRDDVQGARTMGMWALHLARPANGSSQVEAQQPGQAQEPVLCGLDELLQQVVILNQSV